MWFCKRKKKWWYFDKPCRVSFLLPTSSSLSLQLFYLWQDINSQKNKTSVVSGFQIQLSLALRCQAYLLFLLHPSSTVTSLSLSLSFSHIFSLHPHEMCLTFPKGAATTCVLYFLLLSTTSQEEMPHGQHFPCSLKPSLVNAIISV